MPYIKQKDRDFIKDNEVTPSNVGEFNYVITELIKSYVNKHGLSYRTINDVIGVLEASKLEFYRRIAVPYEDIKIEENGDVYE